MNEMNLESDENFLVAVQAQIPIDGDEVIVIESSDEEDVNVNDHVPIDNPQENTSDDDDNVEFDEDVEESSSDDQEGENVLVPEFNQFNVDNYPGDDEIDDEGLLAEGNDDEDREGNANVDDTDRNGPACIICMEVQINVMFEPCHHVVTCGKCSMGLTECCVCRRKVDKLVKVFLP